MYCICCGDPVLCPLCGDLGCFCEQAGQAPNRDFFVKAVGTTPKCLQKHLKSANISPATQVGLRKHVITLFFNDGTHRQYLASMPSYLDDEAQITIDTTGQVNACAREAVLTYFSIGAFSKYVLATYNGETCVEAQLCENVQPGGASARSYTAGNGYKVVLKFKYKFIQSVTGENNMAIWARKPGLTELAVEENAASKTKPYIPGNDEIAALTKVTPACVKEYLDCLQKLRSANPGLMMHAKWRTVLTLFYRDGSHREYLVAREAGVQHGLDGEIVVSLEDEMLAPGFDSCVFAMYDSCGYLAHYELYKTENAVCVNIHKVKFKGTYIKNTLSEEVKPVLSGEEVIAQATKVMPACLRDYLQRVKITGIPGVVRKVVTFFCKNDVSFRYLVNPGSYSYYIDEDGKTTISIECVTAPPLNFESYAWAEYDVKGELLQAKSFANGPVGVVSSGSNFCTLKFKSSLLAEKTFNSPKPAAWERNQDARKDGFRAGLSLAKAIQEAGGRVPEASELAEMTLEDFVSQIAAQNGIRFVYERPDEVKNVAENRK